MHSTSLFEKKTLFLYVGCALETAATTFSTCRKQGSIQWEEDARRNLENKTCGAKESKKESVVSHRNTKSNHRGSKIITVRRHSTFSQIKAERRGRSDHLLMRKRFLLRTKLMSLFSIPGRTEKKTAEVHRCVDMLSYNVYVRRYSTTERFRCVHRLHKRSGGIVTVFG